MVSLSNHVYNSTTYITLRQAQGDKKDFCKRLRLNDFVPAGIFGSVKTFIGAFDNIFNIFFNIVLDNSVRYSNANRNRYILSALLI